jgi:hypothetical protein
VKWNGYLVVTCVPDEEAMSVVEAIMEGARRSRAEERAAVAAWLRREITKCGCDDDTAACIERGERRREEEP